MGSEMEKKCAHSDTPVWTLAHVQYAQGAEGKPGAEHCEVLKCSLGAVSLCGVFRMSAHFEARSRVVPCRTPMGKLRVPIEVQVPPGTRAQDIQCGLQSRHMALALGGCEILKRNR